MSLERTLFGHVDGRPVHRYVMGNRHGTSVAVLTLGANLQSVRTRGRGGSDEITLAYDEVAGYLDPGTPYFGATVGRVANRIAGGEFELDGVCCRLACNAGDVHLHGGEVGFDRRLWHAAAREGDGAARVVLRYRSPAGEEGYPGTLAAQVAYRLTDHDELVIDLQASTDAPTIVNLANHAYWNLAGAGSGGVAQHELQLHCPQVLEKDTDSVPTGRILPVAGTPFDFTVPARRRRAHRRGRRLRPLLRDRWRAGPRCWRASARRLPDDWQARYGYRPLLLETFVQSDRFAGTSYRAANWTHVGQTQGRGKLDVHRTHALPRKDIWLYPLRRDFRRRLCAPLNPPPNG